MYETSRPSRDGGHIALDHFLVVEADDLVGAIISFFIIKAVWEKGRQPSSGKLFCVSWVQLF